MYYWILVSTLLTATVAHSQVSAVPQPGVSSARTSAFSGLAQVPEANLFVGAATTSIDIEVPIGRKNLTPKLALTYNSGKGPSAYGYGWDLPLGTISRNRKRGVLRCNDSVGRREFVLSLPQVSVECSLDVEANGWQRCVPQIEEGFLRIAYHAATNQWSVREKGGLQYRFGEVDQARVGTVTHAGWSDGTTCRYTSSWALTSVEDGNGNRVEVDYERLENVLYPRNVRYGGNPGQSLPHPFEVRFAWRSRAPSDLPLDASAGVPARLTRLLQSVEVAHPAGAAPVRSYRMSYDFEATATRRQARQSFLTSVTMYGRTGLALARADGLPASTTFAYHQPSQDRRRLSGTALTWPSTVRALRMETGSDEHRYVRSDVRDMNGDGILDLVDASGCAASNRRWKVFLGSARGFETEALNWVTIDADWACDLSNVDIDENDSDTDHETIDINADGLPDLVNARVQPWQIHFGRAPSGSLGWRFDPFPVSWEARVVTDLGVRVYALRATDQGRGWVDVLDWNGDGLPDLINARTSRVHFNTGFGFDTAGTVVIFPDARFRDGGAHRSREGLFDMNGDGLPDLVRSVNGSDDWEVHLNEGPQLAAVPQAWHAPSDCAEGITSMRGGDQTERDLLDINGDGLLDLVESCNWTPQSPFWRVRLNSGAGFREDAVGWRSPLQWIRFEDYCQVSQNTRCVYYQTLDGDGDAIPDIIDSGGDNAYEYPAQYWLHRNGSGAWQAGCDGACPNAAGSRPDLLNLIENGVGGVTTLDYRPSTQWDNTDAAGVPHLPMVLWNVSTITRMYSPVPQMPGSSRLTTNYRYAYGKFDPNMREFRGFGTVYAVDGAGTQTTTVFKQDAARKGKIEQVRLHAPGKDPDSDVPLEASLNQWNCADPSSGNARSCPESLARDERRWPRLTASHRYTYNANGIDDLLFKHSVAENLAWDSVGNITHIRRSGDNATPQLDTYTEYALIDASPAGRYHGDKPKHVRTVSGTAINERWFFYDQLAAGSITRGNLTAEETWVDVSAVSLDACTAESNKKCVSKHFEVDAFGNVTAIRDAMNRRTVIELDDIRLYPIATTNPLGHVVQTQYDAACSKQAWQSVPNGASGERRVYDAFCRLTQHYLPGQSSPNERIHYYLGGPNVATDILTEKAETGSPTGWNETDDLFDPLGRPLQRLRAASVDGYRTLVADNTVGYDERGAVISVRSAFLTSYSFGPNGIALYRAAPPGGQTAMERDALGRLTRTRHPDGTERRADHTVAWQSTTTDECYFAGGCTGSKIVEVHDAAGRAIEKRSYERPAAGAEVLKSGTLYEYDGLGRPVSTMQWDGSRYATATRITTGYDSLGRRVAHNDPDSGEWMYGYDRAGNLLYEDDPKPGQHVQFCYDAADRVAEKYVFRSRDYGDVGSACGGFEDPEVTYEYDDPAIANSAGRLTRVDDRSGTTVMSGYDVEGRARQVTRELILGATRERVSLEYEYDRVGHLTAVRYPDGERVVYGYDGTGQVESLRSADGAAVYLANQTYDVFARPRQTTHGNGPNGVGVTDVREYFGADQQHRLSRLYVSPAASVASMPNCANAGLLLDLGFSQYTANGFLRELSDGNASCGSLSSSASFRYDGVGRLVEVSGNPALNAVFQYDLLGNLTGKEGRQLSYSRSKPHTLVSIDGTAVAHDRNGNRTGKPGASYAYAPEDRLESVNGGQVSLAYDYTGRQVLRTTGAGTVRYFDQLAEYRIEGGRGILTKHYLAGTQRIASREANWTPQLLMADSAPWITVAGRSGPTPRLLLFLRSDLQHVLGFAIGATLLGILILPERRRHAVVGIRLRRSRVIGVILLFGCTSLPLPCELLPLTARRAYAGGGGGGYVTQPTPTRPPAPLRFVHYHVDHLGSTQLITDAQGGVVQHVRYRPYGEVRGRWDRQLAAVSDSFRYEFTGFESDAVSGLQYAGARFYDPALGLFLTQDPSRQFASPYSYGGGDPLNWSDPDGRWFSTFLFSVLIAAAVSATVNSAAAAAQGAPLSQIGRAAAFGAAGGAASVGLGVVLAGFNLGLSGALGTLPQLPSLTDAARTFAEVASRSAASSIASNAVGQVASALGAPRGVVVASTLVAGYLAAYGYDSVMLESHGKLPDRDIDGVLTKVSSAARHGGQTARAGSHVFNDPADIATLVRENALQDGDGILNRAMLYNQNHFGSLARETAEQFKRSAIQLHASGARAESLVMLGRASHYVQDQFALGHIFPGTHLLSGPWGAVPRFLIHQTFGGEASFVQGQFDATLDLFRQVGSGTIT